MLTSDCYQILAHSSKVIKLGGGIDPVSDHPSMQNTSFTTVSIGLPLRFFHGLERSNVPSSSSRILEICFLDFRKHFLGQIDITSVNNNLLFVHFDFGF